MTLIELIRHFLELLAARLYFTAGNNGPYFALILVSLVTIRFIFKRKKLRLKLKYILKRGLKHGSSYIRKEKSKPNFNILKSVFMDGMSYRYREWAKPVLYFCTETSRTGGKVDDESESNSEGSSHDENEDSVDKESKLGKICSDDSKTCISSTKAVFEDLPPSQIDNKRKAESHKSLSPKRSKSANSLKVGQESNPTQETTEVRIKNPSEMSCTNRSSGTLKIQLSDPQFTNVQEASSKNKRTDFDEPTKITADNLSIEKDKTSDFPSQISYVKDGNLNSENFPRNNSNDESMKSGFSENLSSLDVRSALKNTVTVSQTKRIVTESAQTETNKSYPIPREFRSNPLQEKSNNAPSDPRIGRKYTSGNESSGEPSRSLGENPGFKITEGGIHMRHNMASKECRPVFPEISYSAALREQAKRLQNAQLPSSDTSENVTKVVRQFFKDVENYKESLKTSNENVHLDSSIFSSALEEKSECSGLMHTSVEGPEAASDILPCSSTGESSSSIENVMGEHSKDTSKVKTYPGLSLQPLNVKKDARYQKKFYKEGKEITLPKKLGEVIQWAAKKSRDEVPIPASEILPSDEINLPIDEYRERAQALTQSFMTMFDSAREQKAKNKLDRKSRKEQNELMMRENTGYVQSSFKEESPSSESSSDSLPTSGDSPVKTRIPPVSCSKISPDISMVEVSPVKCVAKVSPRFSSHSENLRKASLCTQNIGHLSADENACIEPESLISHEFSSLSVLIHFIDWRYVVNLRNALFCRDAFWIPDASQENQQLQPFFRIDSIAPVSCSPVSVEEFLNEMRETQQTYYQARFSENKRLFRSYQTDMKICVIPLRRPHNPDSDYELDGDILVKRKSRAEPKRNFSPFASDFDCILDVNMSRRKTTGTVPKSLNEAKRSLNRRERVTSQASNMHQSLAGDSAGTIRNDWTLCEIELGENKILRKRSENFPRNIQSRVAETRIESKMEELPTDVFPSRATCAEKKIEKKSAVPQWKVSSLEELPVLFGFPSPELLSRMEYDPKFPCSFSNPNRRHTKSESSKYGSNVITVERKKLPQEAQKPQDVSNLCQKSAASGQQESQVRHGVPTKEPVMNKQLNPSSSAKEENAESIQEAYIANKERSTPEKENLPRTDALKSSSASDRKKSAATEKKQSKK